MKRLYQQCCYLTFLLLLLLLWAGPITAQVTSDMLATPTSRPRSSISPLPIDPDTSATSATSSSSTTMPPATDPAAVFDSNNNNNQQSNSGVLDYYFLLLAAVVFIVGLVWWSLVRRNRKKMARSRYHGQSALARDLEGMPGSRRWVTGRFRSSREPAPEEGLDERGQAPPPYMPSPPEAAVHPDATHTEPGAGPAIPLQDLSGEGQKPPNYDEHALPARVIVGNAGSLNLPFARTQSK